MSVLAVLLLAVGVCDLCRRRSFPVWVPVAAGPASVAVTGVLAGLSTPPDIVLLIITGLIAAGWAVLVARSRMRRGSQVWPLLILVCGAAWTIIAGGWASTASGWLGEWLPWSGWPGLQHAGPDRVLLVLGLFAIQFSTGNELVRLVLAAIGAIKPAGQAQAADQLRGGRLLGPMERIFILGLGLAGQMTAAGLVIAAKGIIRFPELSARRADLNARGAETTKISAIGIDEVTEYFLLGSFGSWLIALAGLGMASLG